MNMIVLMALMLRWDIQPWYSEQHFVKVYSTTERTITQKQAQDALVQWIRYYKSDKLPVNTKVRIDDLVILQSNQLTNWSVYAVAPAKNGKYNLIKDSEHRFFYITLYDSSTGRESLPAPRK